MTIFKWLSGRKNKPFLFRSSSVLPPPDFSNSEEYVGRCLALEFPEKSETRSFQSDPRFTPILTALNSQQYAKAIAAAQAILPRFKDFDLVYTWLGNAYRSIQQFDRSREILSEGLARAKRKSLLLTEMGETEWQLGNINRSVYWWSQALHCLSSNLTDYKAYLFLSYVAKGLQLTDVERQLLDQVDRLRAGQVRLESRAAAQLVALAYNEKTEGMRKVLQELQAKYFASHDTETLQSKTREMFQPSGQELKPEIIKLISLLEDPDGRADIISILANREPAERFNTIQLLIDMIDDVPSQRNNISEVVISAIREGYGKNGVEVISLLNLLWRLGDPRAAAIWQLLKTDEFQRADDIMKKL